MKPGNSPPPQDVTEEVSTLIATLHKTEQRLAKLTAGEVDTVADRYGRPLVLGRAQEELRNIDAAKKAAVLETLQRRETELRVLFDLLPAMIWFKDTENRILRVNKHAADAAGRSIEEIEGKASVEIYPRDAAKFFADDLEVISSAKPKLAIIEAIEGPNGEVLWVQTDKVPVCDKDGKVVGVCVIAQDVTERKTAEENQRTTAQLLDNIVENIPSAVQVKSVQNNFRIEMWNKAAAAMYGVPSIEAIGKDVHDLWPKEDADRMQAADKDLAATREMQDFPDRLAQTRTRGNIRVHMRKVALLDDSGNATHLLVVADDMTAEQAAQARLRDSEARFRSLSMLSSDWFWEQDDDHRFVAFSGGDGVQGWGPDQNMAVGLHRWDLGGAVPISSSWEEHKALLDAHKPFRKFEYRRILGDGRLQYVEANGEPVFDATGRFTGYRGVATEITERKRAERELQRFRAAIDSSGDGIVLVDRESMRYVDVNQTICDMVGYTRQELIGMTPMDLFGADRSSLERDYDAIIADDNSSASKIEGHYRHRNGTLIPIETRRRALRTEDGWIIVGNARDITERARTELKIRRLNRVNTMLSQINALIVRAQDREELFREACRIAVSEGGFAVARVIELAADGSARITASSGSDAGVFQRTIEEYNASPEHSQSLLGLALRQGRPLISNDVANDVRIPNREELTREGTYALALLPIVLEKRVAGAISLRAREAGMFDADELRLLLELVSNLSFALELMAKRKELDYLAYYDSLTGLANRTLFLERVAQYTSAAAAGGHKLAVLLIDLERFRNINESLGRPAGDALLKAAAGFLSLGLDDSKLLARVGGDQFAIIVPQLKQDGSVAHLVEKRIQSFVEHPFVLNNTEYRIAVKVGVVLFPNDGADADSLLRNAEAALKNAKASGEKYLFYTQRMNEKVASRLTLENQLRQALENSEFVLHYQPKVHLASGKLAGAEALIRWNDPRTGLVPPGQFIPILEETGLIYDVGRWALRQAVGDYLRWRAAGLPAVRMSVNVSPMQLRNLGFIAEIEQVLGVDPEAAAGLELEITESLIMEDVKRSVASLRAIREMGVHISIDDFGTGFSSLSHLAKLPVDALKIDRSFVTDMTAGPDGLALVSTIINLAHSFKLKVVAEGVETEEQKRLLRLLGCDQMQGFLFSKPVPGDAFEKNFLAAQMTEAPA